MIWTSSCPASSEEEVSVCICAPVCGCMHVDRVRHTMKLYMLETQLSSWVGKAPEWSDYCCPDKILPAAGQVTCVDVFCWRWTHSSWLCLFVQAYTEMYFQLFGSSPLLSRSLHEAKQKWSCYVWTWCWVHSLAAEEAVARLFICGFFCVYADECCVLTIM